MDWLVDRDHHDTVDAVVRQVEAYVADHADRSSRRLADDIRAALESTLGRICRCGGSRARVELDWAGEAPILRALAPPAGESGADPPAHGADCELRAETPLPARRRGERRFGGRQPGPGMLPAPGDFDDAGWLPREAFMRALAVDMAVSVERLWGPAALDDVLATVGGEIGSRMEDAYRAARGLVEPLTPAQMGELFVGLKKAIGGDFYVIEANDREVVLGNRRCPFGDDVFASPGLCRMTSSVFGGIAARNAGAAAVHLDERIAVGDERCRVRVTLGEGHGEAAGARREGLRASPLRVGILSPSGFVAESIAAGLTEQDLRVGVCIDDPDSIGEAVAGEVLDVLLVDLPQHDAERAVDAALTARAHQPGLATVVLCDAPAPTATRRLVASGGGVAHLVKGRETDMATLVGAIHMAAQGGTVLSPAIAETLADQGGDPLAELTPRELEVLRLVADGLSNQAIAETLVISKRAVEKHLGNVFAKLRINERHDRRVEAGLVYRRAHGLGDRL